MQAGGGGGLDGVAISGRAASTRRPPQASELSASHSDIVANAELLKPATTVHAVRKAQDLKYANDLERFKRPLQTTEQRDAFQRFSLKEMADAIGTTPYLEERRRAREDAHRRRIAQKAAKAAAKHGVAAPLLRVLAGSEAASGRSSKPRSASASGHHPRSTSGASRAPTESAVGPRASGASSVGEEAVRAESTQWQCGHIQGVESDAEGEAPVAEGEEDTLPFPADARGNASVQAASVASSRSQSHPERNIRSVGEVYRSRASEASRISSRSSAGSEASATLGEAVAASSAPAPAPRAASSSSSSRSSFRPPSTGGVPAASKALHVLSSTLDAPGDARVAEALKVLEDALGSGRRPFSAASTRSASSSASVVSSRSAGSHISAASSRSAGGASRASRASAASSAGSRPPPPSSFSTQHHLEEALVPSAASASGSVPRTRPAPGSGSKPRSRSTPTVRSPAYQPYQPRSGGH